MADVDILGSYLDPLNQDIGSGKLINVRPVLRQAAEQKPGKARLLGTPGLTVVCAPTGAACVVLCHALNSVWSGHADGSIFYDVHTATPKSAGKVQVNPVAPIIRMAEDRTALAIAANFDTSGKGGNGAGYTATQSAGVVNANFADSDNIEFDPWSVCELDNMTVWAGASNVFANQSSKMYNSIPLAPANVPANNFDTKEARADPVLDVMTTGRYFWPFGSRSIEQFYDSGSGSDFPFVPFTNSLIEVGLAVRLSLASLHGRLIWIGTDKRIWLGSGQSGQPVSPAWINLLLQQLSVADFASLTGYAYSQGGDDFYTLTLPGKWSIEGALSTNFWSYRKSPGRPDHAGRCAVEHDSGVTYVGLDTGQICYVDLTSASEPAGLIERTMITPWIGNQETYETINRVDITSGMGPGAGTFQLDWSKDGLQTFKGVRQITFPEVGARRAIARGLGSERRRQLRFQYSGNAAPFYFDEIFVDKAAGT